MKRKAQVRHQKQSKPTKALSRSRVQKRVQTAEAARAQTDSATYIPASLAKNRFARVIDDATQGREVFITRHKSPKVVVISVEKYNALSAATRSVLDRLTAQFDARLAAMQTAESQRAMNKAFHASPGELGRAALKASRSRS